jgi:hypothetical protein
MTVLWELVHAQPQQTDEQQQQQQQQELASNAAHITFLVLAAVKAVGGQLACLSFCTPGLVNLGLLGERRSTTSSKCWELLLLGLQGMPRLSLLCLHGWIIGRKMVDSNGASVDVLEQMRKQVPWCKVVEECY